MPGDDNEPKGDVKTPEGNTGQTPKETETLTKQEADAQTAKAVQAEKTDVGRLEKALKESNRIASAAITRLKERDEAEFDRQEAAAQGDSDELSRIRKRRQDTERATKLEDREAKVSQREAKANTQLSKSLSEQYNVSQETLMEYAGEDADAMDKLAKSYGERESDESKTTRMTDKPEPGKTTGGSAGLTAEDVSKMSPEEQNRRSEEIANLPFLASPK